MKSRKQVEQALRFCALVAVSPNGPLKPSFLIETCGLMRGYVAKTLLSLARGEVIVAGPGCDHKLGRDPQTISVLEITAAIEEPPDFIKSKARTPHSRGSLVINTLLVVGRRIAEDEAAWQAVLATTSIVDPVGQLKFASTPTPDLRQR